VKKVAEDASREVLDLSGSLAYGGAPVSGRDAAPSLGRDGRRLRSPIPTSAGTVPIRCGWRKAICNSGLAGWCRWAPHRGWCVGLA